MANDAYEKFWGCTLAKNKKEFMWDPTTESEDDIEHKLQVTSACLGPKAKDGERNLVELTTEDDDGKKITCSMVSLRTGGKECLHLELGFSNPTKFTLKEGTGPISLCGVHLQAMPLDFDEDDSESDEDIPDLVNPSNKKPVIKEVNKKETNKKTAIPIGEKKNSTTKRPLEDKKGTEEKPAAKKKKPEPVQFDDSEDDDEEDDDEEDDDDEEMPSLLDGEAEEDDDEESEDEDEPEDGDEVDSDDDEEEESDEDDDDDEEEEEEEQTQKKKLTNGLAKKTGKTPQKAGEKKTPLKTSGKKEPPVTPKSAGAKKTPDEIKALLLKSPNIPKTYEKFANFMKNNIKVTDAKTQKEFWEFVQKNKK